MASDRDPSAWALERAKALPRFSIKFYSAGVGHQPDEAGEWLHITDVARALDAARAEADGPWKQAVIDATIVDWVYTAEHETNPRKAINDLCVQAARIALDPAVSEEARALADAARAEERAERILRELVQQGRLWVDQRDLAAMRVRLVYEPEAAALRTRGEEDR